MGAAVANLSLLAGAAPAAAMKSALELRYALVPYLYSLAHEMYGAGGACCCC